MLSLNTTHNADTKKNIMENACMSAKGIIFQKRIHDLLLSKIVYLRDIIYKNFARFKGIILSYKYESFFICPSFFCVVWRVTFRNMIIFYK